MKTYTRNVKNAFIAIILILFLGCVIIASGILESQANVNDNICFSGRWFEKEIDGKTVQVALNQGAMMYFSVEGTEMIEVYFHDLLKLDTPYFAYSIDGGDMVRQKITEKQILLPDMEEHTIYIIIDSMLPNRERWNNESGVAFEKIDSHGGVIKKLVKNKKRILFIGDSITEGIMSIGLVGNCEDNSAINSYTWHTAQQLEVEPYFLAYGGIGVSERGSFTLVSEVMDHLSSTRKADVVPDCDLIVFNIGSNDTNIDSKTFVEEYQKVILDLHERYKDISIICMIPNNQNHATDIKQAVSDYEWCYIVETEDWDIASYDGIHPIAEGCEAMADYLVEYIKEYNLMKK